MQTTGTPRKRSAARLSESSTPHPLGPQLGAGGNAGGPVKEKTVHAALTKQRIHAIVGQVIDELEHRRATGKADYVKALADEVQRGGLAAWKALRELLPRDEDTSSPGTSLKIGQLLMAAHKEINSSEQAKTIPPVIDVIAEPILALPGLTNTRDGAGGRQPSDPLGETCGSDAGDRGHRGACVGRGIGGRSGLVRARKDEQHQIQQYRGVARTMRPRSNVKGRQEAAVLHGRTTIEIDERYAEAPLPATGRKVDGQKARNCDETCYDC
jgi:hypothetical protein